MSAREGDGGSSSSGSSSSGSGSVPSGADARLPRPIAARRTRTAGSDGLGPRGATASSGLGSGGSPALAGGSPAPKASPGVDRPPPPPDLGGWSGVGSGVTWAARSLAPPPAPSPAPRSSAGPARSKLARERSWEGPKEEVDRLVQPLSAQLLARPAPFPFLLPGRWRLQGRQRGCT